MKKIAIFVDGSNFGQALKLAGFYVDYQKMREYFASYGELVGSYYFTALPPRGEHTTIRPLLDALQYKGWKLVSKETTVNQDGKMKGNMDIEIVIQGIRLLDNEAITDLVLLSGDGDFVSFTDYLRDNGVRVTAISHHTHDRTNMTADSLRQSVHEFINLKDIRPHIESKRRPENGVDIRRHRFLEGK